MLLVTTFGASMDPITNNCANEPVKNPARSDEVVVQGGAAHVELIRTAMTHAYRVFVNALSIASRFNRFHVVGDTIHDSVIKDLTDVDQQNHVALAAFDDAEPGRMIAEARYIVDERCSAEFAIAVADSWQRKGLGRALASILLGYARTHRVIRIWGTVQRSNKPMQALARRLGFIARYYPPDSKLLLIERGL
jgi:GNAT superfamily N-acetyltransferase